MKFGFEGGQVPLLMRQPKLGGFKRPRRLTYSVINLSALESLEAGKYDVNALRKQRLARKTRPVKVLGEGKLTKKFDLSVHAVSQSAKAAIEKAGGSVTILRD
jgi:large subunit ribosomal protein L15